MTDLLDRAVLAVAKHRSLDRFAVRALLKANELLGLALGVRLAELRDSGDRFASRFADSEAHALQARLFAESASIVAERWDKLSERRRPHYNPHQRYRILRIRKLLGLSIRETAERFRVAPGTIVRWENEARRAPESETVGSLVQPVPPVRRYADVVRHVIQSMALAGFGGSQTIADTLARAGWKLSKRTIGRVLKETPAPSPAPLTSTEERAVVARYPGHIFMADLTDVPSLFGLFRFKLAVVLDVFSRFPLAFHIFYFEPSASRMIAPLEHAIQRFGAPTYFVSDRGSQLSAESFRDFVKRHGSGHRFGAVGKTGSIAIIERLWKALKQQLSLRLFPPLVLDELNRRVEQGLTHYAFYRPHQGLGGKTPAELFFGHENTPLTSFPPPRGQPGQLAGECPFRIDYLDTEGRLPILSKAA